MAGQEDPLVEEMATRSSVPAWRSPAGYSPRGRRVGHDWSSSAPTETLPLIFSYSFWLRRVSAAEAGLACSSKCGLAFRETGVGARGALSRARLCDPVDCSLPSSSVHGILQAGTLTRVAVPSSRDLLTQGWNPRLLRLLHLRQEWAAREARERAGELHKPKSWVAMTGSYC